MFTIFWCLCRFKLGLLACGNTVVHTRITYVLKSCCFSLSHLLASLPSVPFSPLICTAPPSPRREDCMWGPPAEEGSSGAGPHREDPATAWTSGATARTHTAPGEPWVNTHRHALEHTQTDISKKDIFPHNLLFSDVVKQKGSGTQKRLNKRRALKVPYDWLP